VASSAGKQRGFRTPVTPGPQSAYSGDVKRLLGPLLVLALIVEAAGSGGGAFFCRMLGERLVSCCCPDDVTATAEPVLVSTSCCDVLEGAAPAISEGAPARLVADGPDRLLVSMEVEPPHPLTALVPTRRALTWGSASARPRRIPVFLSLRQLVI
jgi:hypothetical protein